RERLAPGGALVLDAFVPQAVQSFAEFRPDYRRRHGDGMLERHKRITANADGTNRIERRYRLYSAGAAAPREEFHTVDTIRPYLPSDLAAIAVSAGLEVDEWFYDYGVHDTAHEARFATVVLRC